MRHKYLKKTHREIFQEFNAKYPDIKMGQRTFENCKQFFVVPARTSDRNSCCRIHVKTQMLFSTCLNFRKRLQTEKLQLEKDYPVFEHLSDFVDKTLCTILQRNNHHDKLLRQGM